MDQYFFQPKNNAQMVDMKCALSAYKTKNLNFSKHRLVTYLNDIIEMLIINLKTGYFVRLVEDHYRLNFFKTVFYSCPVFQ